ncbi:hypothetical protein B0H14DRAFT_2730781 [Mycena olivaceomarginata]|nr:hypothetical protein B0H14DRAFT_2730781 [Mycena olivaceomarginata]
MSDAFGHIENDSCVRFRAHSASALRPYIALMSEEDNAQAQEIILQDYCHLVGICLLYFDHLLTADAEVHFIWSRRRTTSTYWFLTNRYLAFLGNIPVAIMPFATLSPRVTILRQVHLFATQVVVSLIMILRVYALYGSSLRVACLLLWIGACVIAVTVWSMNGQKGAPAFLEGCHVAIMRSTYGCAWQSLLFLDCTIFGFTVFNAYTTTRRIGPLANLPLHQLIVRDGALYFAAVAVANFSNMSTFYPLFRGALSTFSSCIAVTMVSRLMLNLHKQAEVGIFTDTSSSIEIFVDAAVYSEPEDTGLRPNSPIVGEGPGA